MCSDTTEKVINSFIYMHFIPCINTVKSICGMKIVNGEIFCRKWPTIYIWSIVLGINKDMVKQPLTNLNSYKNVEIHSRIGWRTVGILAMIFDRSLQNWGLRCLPLGKEKKRTLIILLVSLTSMPGKMLNHQIKQVICKHLEDNIDSMTLSEALHVIQLSSPSLTRLLL